MYDIPIDYFVSPITKSSLIQKNENLLADNDGCEFHKNKEHGFWNFLPNRSPLYNEEEWLSFQKLIKNFVISYDKDPSKNVSYNARPDALLFGDFCKYHGEVLDIGCGPHPVPSYIKFKRKEDVKYFGIDVLIGEQPKEHNFIQAMGEHLPFKDGLFDITISGTSILHYVDVKAGIREALRVTKKEGYLCIWLGVKSDEAPPPTESPEWYKSLEIPDGAENPFHYKRYTEEYFEGLFEECNGILIEKEVHVVDKWRKNIFFRLRNNN
ncbi:MAG TPA: class I SAM-dependent methyltransferase [Flavobacteriales bacterium]|nr:class I SAM-dependent methyltransferase [Flavobacteriales bacterium]